MTSVVSLVRQVGSGFVHCIVDVSWEVWPHATLVVVVRRVKRGGHGRRTLNGYPKRLSVKLLSYKGMFNQASNVNGTGTQTHARGDFISSPSTASNGIQVTSTFGLYSIAIIALSIKPYCSLTKDPKSKTQ